jgi:hypothetical protein
MLGKYPQARATPASFKHAIVSDLVIGILIGRFAGFERR